MDRFLWIDRSIFKNVGICKLINVIISVFHRLITSNVICCPPSCRQSGCCVVSLKYYWQPSPKVFQNYSPSPRVFPSSFNSVCCQSIQHWMRWLDVLPLRRLFHVSTLTVIVNFPPKKVFDSICGLMSHARGTCHRALCMLHPVRLLMLMDLSGVQDIRRNPCVWIQLCVQMHRRIVHTTSLTTMTS